MAVSTGTTWCGLIDEVVAELPDDPVVADARALFERVALGEEFTEFLTLPAYERLLQLTS